MKLFVIALVLTLVSCRPDCSSTDSTCSSSTDTETTTGSSSTDTETTTGSSGTSATPGYQHKLIRYKFNFCSYHFPIFILCFVFLYILIAMGLNIVYLLFQFCVLVKTKVITATVKETVDLICAPAPRRRSVADWKVYVLHLSIINYTNNY